jgi:hypothetical protein
LVARLAKAMRFCSRLIRGVSSRMNKKTQDWIAVAGVLVFFSLALYGALAWYFPAQWLSVTLAVLMILASLYFSVRLTPFAARPSLITPFQFFAGLLIMSFVCWTVIGLAIPAIVMSFLGPNERMTVTVVEKRYSRRSCSSFRLAELSAPLKEKLCVGSTLYDKVVEGERVSVTVRRNALGTRVFEIDPS